MCVLQIAKGDGVYFVDFNGKRYLDFNAMAMCSNLGHTVDPTIIDAVTEQMRTMCYAYPGAFITEIRCKLSKVLTPPILPSLRKRADETLRSCLPTCARATSRPSSSPRAALRPTRRPSAWPAS